QSLATWEHLGRLFRLLSRWMCSFFPCSSGTLSHSARSRSTNRPALPEAARFHRIHTTNHSRVSLRISLKPRSDKHETKPVVGRLYMECDAVPAGCVRFGGKP